MLSCHYRVERQIFCELLRFLITQGWVLFPKFYEWTKPNDLLVHTSESVETIDMWLLKMFTYPAYIPKSACLKQVLSLKCYVGWAAWGRMPGWQMGAQHKTLAGWCLFLLKHTVWTAAVSLTVCRIDFLQILRKIRCSGDFLKIDFRLPLWDEADVDSAADSEELGKWVTSPFEWKPWRQNKYTPSTLSLLAMFMCGTI